MKTPQDEHIAVRCMRKGCKNEATRWYEDEWGEKGTFYVCLSHRDVARAEEDGFGMIKNNQDKLVELAVYACSEECGVCN